MKAKWKRLERLEKWGFEKVKKVVIDVNAY